VIANDFSQDITGADLEDRDRAGDEQSAGLR
jgi:hypothetical protein